MSDEALRQLQERYPPIITTAMVAEILELNVRTVLLMARTAAFRHPAFPALGPTDSSCRTWCACSMKTASCRGR